MNISKSTNKLISCLPEFNYNVNIKHNFIKKLEKIIQNVFIKREYKITKDVIFKKQLNKESNDYPLIYQLFQILINKKIIELDIKSFKEFCNYFNTNNVYQLIQNNKKKIKKDTKEYELYKILFNNDNLDRQNLNSLLYENDFISIDIQYYSEISDINYQNIIYEYDNKKLDINLYFLNKYYIPNINLIINISILIYELSKLYSNKSFKLPKLNLFCGLQKKKLNNMNNELFPENVNSGSTLYNEFINIWRLEEIYKVLIHESIHFYGMDFYIFDNGNKQIENYIQKKFCVHGENRANESYTETLALIIHSVVISYISKLELNIILTNEIKFSLFQVNKILKFFNIQNISDIIDKDKCHKNIVQYTSVLSYYIIKLFNLLNLNSFLDFIDKDIFIKNKIDEYNKLIDQHINNDSIFIIESYKSNKNIKIDDSFINSTMRMSLYTLSKNTQLM